MGYLKGKSSLMIFDRHANLKYKYGNRHFWARGYYMDTVGRKKKQVADQIANRNERICRPVHGSREQEGVKDPLKGHSPYKALIVLTQASGLARGFDCLYSRCECEYAVNRYTWF